MQPEVINYEANRELRWIGKLFASHIFDGEHAFVLHDNGDGTTTFMQYEHFRGILVPFLKKMLDVDTKASFMQMNEALKKRVESSN
ncbi:SRPBCC domain-containing protein [Flavipsychrobacter stenotrophus]|nr:SRPBCC domain-containing protein [Flavipsychrobacter stenotrophus]